MKIYSRYDGTQVLFENDGTTLRETVLAAVASRANLSRANLYGADLYGANLSRANLYGADLYGADLSGANLSGADLSGADLYGADLSGANLYGADLSGADLSGANLYGADLSGADLYGADLSGADLSGADLSGADLSGADLSPVKLDVWDVLLRAPNEVAALADALRAGKVDGSVYQGDCACLVGTIANAAQKNYEELELIQPNSSRPAERWFLAIRQGDTPDKSNVAKLTLEWVEEFQKLLDRAIDLRMVVTK